MRQIVLDTETTGLMLEKGNRIIEIGGVELIDRKHTGRHFHQYINPQREIEAGAMEVHGITREFLEDKPLFADVCDDFVDFIRGAELIIHNAPFDIAYLDHELSRVPGKEARVADLCQIEDVLELARHRHPGQRNTLDALCRRYQVDNRARTLHGALLDAELLADVYLIMTGGQTGMFANPQDQDAASAVAEEHFEPLPADRPRLRIITATAEELAAHERMLEALGEHCVWTRIRRSQ